MSPLIRLNPPCYNGDIQAINAGSPDVHINLQYNKWTEVQEKWLRKSMPTKHKYILKNLNFKTTPRWPKVQSPFPSRKLNTLVRFCAPSK